MQEACKVSLIGCVLAQVFWPAAVNTSRKFALGEVWHNAIASELVLYNASNKCAQSGSPGANTLLFFGSDGWPKSFCCSTLVHGTM